MRSIFEGRGVLRCGLSFSFAILPDRNTTSQYPNNSAQHFHCFWDGVQEVLEHAPKIGRLAHKRSGYSITTVMRATPHTLAMPENNRATPIRLQEVYGVVYFLRRL
jgi:hypothetical protein